MWLKVVAPTADFHRIPKSRNRTVRILLLTVENEISLFYNGTASCILLLFAILDTHIRTVGNYVNSGK